MSDIIVSVASNLMTAAARLEDHRRDCGGGGGVTASTLFEASALVAAIGIVFPVRNTDGFLARIAKAEARKAACWLQDQKSGKARPEKKRKKEQQPPAAGMASKSEPAKTEVDPFGNSIALNQIFVQTSTEQIITLDVRPYCQQHTSSYVSSACNPTAKDVKAKIQDQEGTPVEQQRLMFEGSVLDDDTRSFFNCNQNYNRDNYGMPNKATLHLVNRLRGNPSAPAFKPDDIEALLANAGLVEPSEMNVVCLGAVLEFLVAEILELAGSAARDATKEATVSRLDPQHLSRAIRKDTGLNQMLGASNIIAAGALPNIHAVMLPNRKRGPAGQWLTVDLAKPPKPTMDPVGFARTSNGAEPPASAGTYRQSPLIETVLSTPALYSIAARAGCFRPVMSLTQPPSFLCLTRGH